MESWISREPIPVAEVNTIDIGVLCTELYERSQLLDSRAELYEEDLPGFNEALGLDDLPIQPDSYRIYKSKNRLASRWHFDGSGDLMKDGKLPRIAIFSSSEPSEILVGEIPVSCNGWWEIGPKDETVEEALRAGTLEKREIKPYIYYLLPSGTIHRKPADAGTNAVRLFGRWMQK